MIRGDFGEIFDRPTLKLHAAHDQHNFLSKEKYVESFAIKYNYCQVLLRLLSFTFGLFNQNTAKEDLKIKANQDKQK